MIFTSVENPKSINTVQVLMNILHFVKVLFKKIFFHSKNSNLLEYWEERVKKHGQTSVLNLAHSPDEFEEVGQKQKQAIFPHFIASLKGDDKVVLDFGCGCGRFTPDLASLVEGKAIGIDPIKALIEIAPKNENVDYRVMKLGDIPLGDESVDVVWSCLVLGCIPENDLKQSVKEINRVLKNGGLLFIIESTSMRTNVKHFSYRTIDDYSKMFNFASLIHLHDYFDMGDKISLMAGRKNLNAT
jgi:SAM-dependent methyltransferase